VVRRPAHSPPARWAALCDHYSRRPHHARLWASDTASGSLGDRRVRPRAGGQPNGGSQAATGAEVSTHTKEPQSATPAQYRIGPNAPWARAWKIAAGVGVVGLAIGLYGYKTDPTRF